METGFTGIAAKYKALLDASTSCHFISLFYYI